MEPNPKDGKFTQWQLIWIVAVVSFALASAAWTVGRSKMSDDLESYKAAEKLNFREALAELITLSKTTALAVGERNALNDATKNMAALKTENDALKVALDESTKRLEVAELKLKEMTAETFVIRAGASRFVYEKSLALGVTSASDILKTCKVQLGNTAAELAPGQDLAENRAGKRIVVTLVAVARDECRFAVAN